MKSGSKRETRRRWMTYPIYVLCALLLLDLLFFFITLDETRVFIGERGVEYCWAYGSFLRYATSHLASIGVALAILYLLYRLARNDYLIAYLSIASACLITKMVWSALGFGLC
jgi:hypothetical protein